MSNVIPTVKTVLVAEDDTNDRMLFEGAVRVLNPPVQFKFVRDGEVAIKYLKGEGPFENRDTNPLPSLVLLDVRMPKIDGIQVLQWIKSNAQFKDIKVLVWADSEFKEHIDRARAAGADDIVKKPFYQKGLVEVVRDIVKRVQVGI